jgi:hypothetical protein
MDFFTTLTREVHEPAHSQRHLPGRTDLYRYLIGRTTHTAGFDLNHRLDVFQRALEHFERVFLGFVSDNIQCPVYDLFGYGFLTVFHDMVNELGETFTVEFRIRDDFPLGCYTSSWHR